MSIISITSVTPITIVTRSILAGSVGGLAAALFVGLVGEDGIEAALAVERSLDPTAGAAPLVSRPWQVVGGLTAALLYGILSGVVFGTVFAAVRHRIRGVDDFARSVLLASAAFIATGVIPALKYPANPPAVGDPDTVGQRTVQYLTLVLAALVLMVAVGLLFNQLRARFDRPTAIGLGAFGLVVGMLALLVVWPDQGGTIPAELPAELLWRFRLRSLATLALSWATLGLGLGWLLTRPRPRPVSP